MEFIVFTKHWKGAAIEEIFEAAHEIGVQGLDLAVREGYAVNPENVTEALPVAVKKAKAAGLSVPMVTSEGSLLWPDQAAAEPLLAAMDAADVRRVKLGYQTHKTGEMKYWDEIDKLCAAVEGWQKLGEKHNVQICYHTHSGPYYGCNASALMHFIRGSDPKHIGAYLDVAHLLVDGEPFGFALDVVGEFLSIIAFKDAKYVQTMEGDHRGCKREFLPSGHGLVNFDEVFAELARVGFDGPVSVHCEYKKPTEEEFMAAAKAEVAFVKERYAASNREKSQT